MQSERIHIGFFGRCNSGKSSLINALTGQSVSIVSDIAGTTTDTVSKAMEMPGVGAVTLLDTPGLDDTSALGDLRVAAAWKALDKTDIAVILYNDLKDRSLEDLLCEELARRNITMIKVLSACDKTTAGNDAELLPISSATGEGLEKLRQRIAECSKKDELKLTAGLCHSGDTVLLVMPQDSQAPKGRLIQPQVQTIRELLDRGCIPVCCTPDKMGTALKALGEAPKLIITDSQVFKTVWEMKPAGSRITSFSILFARYKGDIAEFVKGAKVIESLTESSRVLIAEACTHVPQHEDIGRVKLPALLRKKAGQLLHIDIVSGADFPDVLEGYDLIIHCGACMFTRRHVMSRIAKAREAGIPITNYGTAIATLTGILDKVAY